MERTLEINWLSRMDKALPLPEVAFANIPNGPAGFYLPPEKSFILLDGNEYDCEHGVISVNTNGDPDDIDGTFAHEWRHHWQHYHGWKYDVPRPRENCSSLREYYLSSKSELDAVIFELSKAQSLSYRESLQLPAKERSTYFDLGKSIHSKN